MCWQNLSLKDPTSQELLEGVERERSLRFSPPRSASIFHHPALGNFELQHVPVGVDTAELEERIIQHLAAAAAIGRTQCSVRREGSMHHPSTHRPEIAVFPSQPNESSAPGGEGIHAIAATGSNASALHAVVNNEGTEHMPSPVRSNQISASSFRSSGMPISERGTTNDDSNSASRSFLTNQDGGGPSEFQSLSDTWRSRLSCLSMKYKESIAKSTKELKEKLFSLSSSIAGVNSEVRRDVNSGIATVSRTLEHLETRDSNREDLGPLSVDAVNSSVIEQSHTNRESTSYASSSVSR